LRKNGTRGVLAFSLVILAAGGAAYACDHEGCAGKSADCADKHAGCATDAKMESAAGEDGHDCGMKAEECSEQMKKDAATHGWLGVGLDLSPEGEMTIAKVWPGSPAEKAGLQVGDRIVAMNGVPVESKNTDKLFSLMKDAKIGDKFSLETVRGADHLSREATLARMPDDLLAESIKKHLQEHHKIAQK
jgi:carboxyl-terminal processing protease